MSECQEWVLTPSKHDEHSRSLSVLLSEWTAAIKLCRLHGGYTPPETAGMTRQQVRWFALGLRKADERGEVDEASREWVDRLLAFLDTDGLGGFTLERKWKRCPTRNNPGTMVAAPSPAAKGRLRKASVATAPAASIRFHHTLTGCIHVIDPSKPVH